MGPVTIWMSPREAAKSLGVTTLDVLSHIDEGSLSAYWSGSVIRIRVEDVEELREPRPVERGEVSSLLESSNVPEVDLVDLIGETLSAGRMGRIIRALSPLVLLLLVAIPAAGFLISSTTWIDPADFDSVVKPLALLGLAASVPVAILVSLAVGLGPEHWAIVRRALGNRGVGMVVTSAVGSMIFFFSSAYWFLSLYRPEAFSESLSKLDALYFTVTAFSTTGFGDIHAVNEAARSFVTAQLIYGFIVISVVVTIVFGQAFSQDQ